MLTEMLDLTLPPLRQKQYKDEIAFWLKLLILFKQAFICKVFFLTELNQFKLLHFFKLNYSSFKTYAGPATIPTLGN